MSADIESRIRKRAHAIWEQEGRPEGCDKEHWDRAEAEVKAAGAKNGGAVKANGSKPVKTTAPKKAVAAGTKTLAAKAKPVAKAAPKAAAKPAPKAKSKAATGKPA